MPLFDGLFSAQPLLSGGLFAPDSKYRRQEAAAHGAALAGDLQEGAMPAKKKRKAASTANGAQQKRGAAMEHGQLDLELAERKVKRSKKAFKAVDTAEAGDAAEPGREAATIRLLGSTPAATATQPLHLASAGSGSTEGAGVAQTASRRSSVLAGEQAKPSKRRKGTAAAPLQPLAAAAGKAAAAKESRQSAGLQAGGGGAGLPAAQPQGLAVPGTAAEAARAAGGAAEGPRNAAPAAGARREPSTAQPRKRQRIEPGALLPPPTAAGSPPAAAAARQAAAEGAPGEAAAPEQTGGPPRRTPEEEAQRLRRTVFVGNLPAAIKAKRVRQTFARCAACAALGT